MRFVSCLLVLLSGIIMAQTTDLQQAPKPQVPKKPGAKSTPKKIPPKKEPAITARKIPASKVMELKGFDAALMDKSADPCGDFYQYSCGGWLKQNPVPGDQSTYGRDTELAERNRLILRDILEKAAQPRAKRSALEQKIGDYYESCMDEAAIEKKGVAALKPELDRIASLQSKDGLPELLAHL